MSGFFTFDINPSNIIQFSAPYPDPSAAGATLTIVTPDSITIAMNPLQAVNCLVDFNFNTPGALVKIAVSDINAEVGSGVTLSKPSGSLLSLPWTYFPPGIYTVTYNPIITASKTTSFLLFTTVDDCLYSQIDTFMYQTCCDVCTNDKKRLVEKLLAVKEGAKLDFKIGANADLANKLTALQYICEDDFCNCNCNC